MLNKFVPNFFNMEKERCYYGKGNMIWKRVHDTLKRFSVFSAQGSESCLLSMSTPRPTGGAISVSSGGRG